MRLRIVSGGPASRFVFDRSLPAAERQETASLRPAELDNPYGRYYTKPRSRADLKKERDRP